MNEHEQAFSVQRSAFRFQRSTCGGCCVSRHAQSYGCACVRVRCCSVHTVGQNMVTPSRIFSHASWNSSVVRDGDEKSIPAMPFTCKSTNGKGKRMVSLCLCVQGVEATRTRQGTQHQNQPAATMARPRTQGHTASVPTGTLFSGDFSGDCHKLADPASSHNTELGCLRSTEAGQAVHTSPVSAALMAGALRVSGTTQLMT